MHSTTPTGTETCRVQIRFLPEACRPAHVVRHLGITLIAVDPRSTRLEVVAWGVDNLTVEENNDARRSYGEPPVGEPIDDEWMNDKLFPIEVPLAAQLRSRPPHRKFPLDPSTADRPIPYGDALPEPARLPRSRRSG